MALGSANWRCRDCEASGSYRNAHGVAAQHHQKTGHVVHVEEHRVYVYRNSVEKSGDNAE